MFNLIISRECVTFVQFPTSIELIINLRLCDDTWTFLNISIVHFHVPIISHQHESLMWMLTMQIIYSPSVSTSKELNHETYAKMSENYSFDDMSHNITHVTPACSRVRWVVDLWRDLCRWRQATHTSFDLNEMRKKCEQNASTHLLACAGIFQGRSDDDSSISFKTLNLLVSLENMSIRSLSVMVNISSVVRVEISPSRMLIFNVFALKSERDEVVNLLAIESSKSGNCFFLITVESWSSKLKSEFYIIESRVKLSMSCILHTSRSSHSLRDIFRVVNELRVAQTWCWLCDVNICCTPLSSFLFIKWLDYLYRLCLRRLLLANEFPRFLSSHTSDIPQHTPATFNCVGVLIQLLAGRRAQLI